MVKFAEDDPNYRDIAVYIYDLVEGLKGHPRNQGNGHLSALKRSESSGGMLSNAIGGEREYIYSGCPEYVRTWVELVLNHRGIQNRKRTNRRIYPFLAVCAAAAT
jgi:hypothetical protein